MVEELLGPGVGNPPQHADQLSSAALAPLIPVEQPRRQQVIERAHREFVIPRPSELHVAAPSVASEAPAAPDRAPDPPSSFDPTRDSEDGAARPVLSTVARWAMVALAMLLAAAAVGAGVASLLSPG